MRLVRFSSAITVAMAAMLMSLLSLAPTVSNAQAPSITIKGAGPQPVSITSAELASMPRATASTSNNGITTTFEGVLLSEVLKKAGVPYTADMHRHLLTGYVIATASDGYEVLFSLGELDPGITSGQYLLADKADGKPMFGTNGDFRLIVPGDKRGARSIRMLTSLTVVMPTR
jgi:hypothetical protein